MNRTTITLTVDYDGYLDPVGLVEYIEAALDSYVGTDYSGIKYQGHYVDYDFDEEVEHGREVQEER